MVIMSVVMPMAMSMAGYMLLARAVNIVNMGPTDNDDEDRTLLLLPLQVSFAVSALRVSPQSF